MTFDPITPAVVILATVFLTWRLKKMSDTNTQVVSDIHSLTQTVATMRDAITAVKARIDALVAAGTIPADAAAELHAAVGEVGTDVTTLQGMGSAPTV